MDYDNYRKSYMPTPEPEPGFEFSGIDGVALFFEDFEAAVKYYTQVLGPAAYVEGKWTRGWRIGSNWLTLLKAKAGAPQNVELILRMSTPGEAERLQAAFIAAGGKGDEPSDQIMYEPVRYCPVQDPWGTMILMISSLT